VGVCGGGVAETSRNGSADIKNAAEEYCIFM